MRRTIHLRFVAEVGSDDDAWDICEGLERAAIRADYLSVSSWIETDGSRDGILVPEGQEPVSSEAMRVERAAGLVPTGVGDAEGVLTPSQFGEAQD